MDKENNVIPMSSRAIDLPVSPFRSTAAEGDLLDAPVVATLMRGKTVAGRLAGVDGPRAIITLQTKDKGRAYVRFSELRCLNFIARNPINRGRHPLQQGHAEDTIMPKASQEFRITFTDQKTLTGRTRGSFVDKVGIHLFQLVDNAHVSRLFVPSQAIRKYYIGQRRDADEASATDPHTKSPKNAAPQPRRRKTDRGQRKRMAADSQALHQALAASANEGDAVAGARRIGEMLVEDKIIRREQLEAALQAQRDAPASKIGEILIRMGMVSAEQIYVALAHKFGLPFVLLRSFFIDIECLNLVPADVVRRYSLVPLLIHKDRLVVAMDDPGNTEALTLLRFMTQYHIEPTIATPDDIDWAIRKYYGVPDAGAASRPASGPRGGRAGSADESARERRNRLTMVKAVTSFIGNTIADAIERDAADIHIVAERSYADLLFRINGVLIPVRRFSRIILPAIIDRLSEMGGMPPEDGDALQCGRARVLSGNALVDVRILIDRQPAVESAILRLVDTGNRLAPLNGLGLQPGELAALEGILSRRGGLVVVAGPADSHRSRTLYAGLRELQQMGRRTMTAETRVSCHLNGIEQLQSKPGEDEAGFLDRMRATAQAGGIEGMVLGELRGPETLQAAVTCARQGAVVLTKLTAPTAAHGLARLMELYRDPGDPGDPGDLGEAIAGVLAQQPVRINCRFCLEEEPVGPAERAALGAGKDEVFYHGAGCADCHGTGHAGTQLVFELLPITPEARAMIQARSAASEIHLQARANGMTSFVTNALELARLRRIPFAEAHRLLRHARVT